MGKSQPPEVAAKKQSIADVLCQDQGGMQYIVEMQVTDTAGLSNVPSTMLPRPTRGSSLREMIIIISGK